MMTKAYVGVPCDIEALRKVEAFSKDTGQYWADDVLRVGLFCRENWAHSCFRALIEDDYGTKMEDVLKFDIKKGNIIAHLKNNGKLELPLEKSKPYVRMGCQVCLDFAAELADISVGAVGTPAKWSTVIARSREGNEIVERAAKEGYIELKPIEEVKPGVKLITRLTDNKRTENIKEAGERELAGFKVLHIKTLNDDLDKSKETSKGKDFKDLEFDIIDTGLCISCGTCEAVCPEGCVKVIDQKPELQGKCKEDCHACYLCCPRTSLPMVSLENKAFGDETPREYGVGKYLKIYAARAKDSAILERGQDGGVVTAILQYALKNGVVDSVISVKKGEDPWMPVPFVSKIGSDLLGASGTIYSHSPSIPTLKNDVVGR
jgi:coenzyme F420 hydrogenase subunit beta